MQAILIQFGAMALLLLPLVGSRNAAKFAVPALARNQTRR